MFAANANSGSMFTIVIYFVVIMAFMYLLMIRPQRKEQKRMAEMLSDVAVGDSVVTSSGFYGVILDVTDDDVIVEFGNNKNCRIPMKKSAIVEVEKASAGISVDASAQGKEKEKED